MLLCSLQSDALGISKPLFYLNRGKMARPFHQDPQLFEGKRQGFTEQVDAGKIIPT